MRRVVLLVLFGLLLGVALTGAAGALPGSQDLNALTWLSSVATVAALVVAVGIFRVQQSQSDLAHQELLDALKAQDEVLQDLAGATSPGESAASAPSRALPESPSPSPVADVGDLTAAQREAVQARYGDRLIEQAWNPGSRGRGNARLVRLDDGTLLTVFNAGHGGDVRIRQVDPRRGGRLEARARRRRDPDRG